MIKAPIDLQDLRRRLYDKAKAEPTWRFWGLYVHVCKMETLQEATRWRRRTMGHRESTGSHSRPSKRAERRVFSGRFRTNWSSKRIGPCGWKKEIPKDGGTKVRVLSIPSIRDRVVQGALKLILEPIFEADFHPGSYGYRPKRTAHEAVNRVAQAIVEEKTRII